MTTTIGAANAKYGSSTWSCEFCGMIFKTCQERGWHRRRKECTMDPSLQKDRKRASSSLGSAPKRVKLPKSPKPLQGVKSGKVLRCVWCDKVFQGPQGLARHIMSCSAKPQEEEGEETGELAEAPKVRLVLQLALLLL